MRRAHFGRTPAMPSTLRALPFVLACSILSGCAAATPPSPEAPGHPHCSYEKHQAAVCQQLRRAVLVEPDGKRVALDVLHCSGGEPRAHVVWARRDTGALLYRGVIAFSVAEPRAPMTAREIEPEIREWPCTDDSCRTMRELAPGTRIAMPILQQCPGAPETKAPEVLVPLPSATATSCIGGWCVDPGDGTERYWIVEHSWLPSITQEAVIEVRGDVVSARTNGKARRILPNNEVDALMPSLEELWHSPLENDASCRDGTTTLIHARRPGTWRIAVRHCVSVPGIGRVLRGPFRSR